MGIMTRSVHTRLHRRRCVALQILIISCNKSETYHNAQISRETCQKVTESRYDKCVFIIYRKRGRGRENTIKYNEFALVSLTVGRKQSSCCEQFLWGKLQRPELHCSMQFLDNSDNYGRTLKADMKCVYL